MNIADANRPYTIVVRIDDSREGYAAAEYACSLCLKLKVKYRLIFLYVVALYKRSNLNLINRQTEQLNAEIRENAEDSMMKCKQFLSRFESLLSFEWISIKDEGNVGPIAAKFIKKELQTVVDLVVVGRSADTALKTIVGGHVSDYFMKTLEVPLMVVKDEFDVSDDE
ncbi:hypothetical protein DL89DRAFT_264304 [Linderina pennispora]|uniref:UspA domain-containing protein n=1 Tax=Linderina pennispora TaxID=61395 RepID=A0A1Y1WLQ2_9FUNG|nr:uncharacterized protein DL89DRAFT_264304 [Linderina pennispora]ORX74433.1 hypothetical protein DL89DRAFT_264304 [Linderina pennispora]